MQRQGLHKAEWEHCCEWSHCCRYCVFHSFLYLAKPLTLCACHRALSERRCSWAHFAKRGQDLRLQGLCDVESEHCRWPHSAPSVQCQRLQELSNAETEHACQCCLFPHACLCSAKPVDFSENPKRQRDRSRASHALGGTCPERRCSSSLQGP
mmetsp:Transcript_6347/g.18115  ORF Transcript_6347/g.18115 Transcript_6347/m.18115 type:complete len:153 (-) Transcript_6347:403-861(-)